MKRLVIDATEGGALIKGSIRKTLQNTLQEYATRSIDKSAINPLLSPADNADELVSKAIPLLEEDCRILSKIGKNALLGLKAIKEMEKDMDNSEGNLSYLLKENEKYSNTAQEYSKKNPLITLAIFGASRSIHNRKYQVKNAKQSAISKKENVEDLKKRIDRNKLILNAAKNASKQLKKLYKNSLKLLREYNKTKNEDLLTSNEIESIDLSDTEKYFERGNFAHPLLDARKLLYNSFLPSKEQKLKELSKRKMDPKILNAIETEKKALNMRKKLTKKAKEMAKKEKIDKRIQYIKLIEKSKEIGEEEIKNEKPNFSKTLPFLKEAMEIVPEISVFLKEQGREEESFWGYATTLNHIEKYQESIDEYRKLIKNFPDSKEKLRYQFEMGLVYLNHSKIKEDPSLFQEGMKIIGKVMEKTDKFDHHLLRFGDLYMNANMYDEALIAYEEYTKKFPQNFEGWLEKGKCLKNLGKVKKARFCFKKAKKIKPDLNIKISKDKNDQALP